MFNEPKRQLWGVLVLLKGMLGGGFFCLGGDFNAVLSWAERRGLSEQNYQSEILGFRRIGGRYQLSGLERETSHITV